MKETIEKVAASDNAPIFLGIDNRTTTAAILIVTNADIQKESLIWSSTKPCTTIKLAPMTPVKNKPIVPSSVLLAFTPNRSPIKEPYPVTFGLISERMTKANKDAKVVSADNTTMIRLIPNVVLANTLGKVSNPPEMVHAKTVVAALIRDVVMQLS